MPDRNFITMSPKKKNGIKSKIDLCRLLLFSQFLQQKQDILLQIIKILDLIQAKNRLDGRITSQVY